MGGLRLLLLLLLLDVLIEMAERRVLHRSGGRGG